MEALIIVESPTKAKTIRSFFPQYKTIATRGYLKDLPKDSLALSIENNHFKGDYRFLSGKKKLSDEIRALAANAHNIYLAVDDDREGETIANQVAVSALKEFNYTRIVFHEITKTAIENAIRAGGREIINNKVIAGKTRRLGDRLIGYPMSDILAFDFKQKGYPYTPKGIGRVISPSLKILYDNNTRIEEFVPTEYYQIGIEYYHENALFKAMVPTKFDIDDKDTVDEMMMFIGNSDHVISKYHEKTRELSPYPPLVTARLVRSAFYLYGYKPKKTMKIAQELYENGLITYMRTDSMSLSDEAVEDMIGYLKTLYGPEYIVDRKREYKQSNSARVQGAHEAIRPTSFDMQHTPELLLNTYQNLTDEHKKLYEFIFYRTLATQMRNAIYDASTVEIEIGGSITVSAKANKVIFDGWQNINAQLLMEAERKEGEEWKDKTVHIPRCVPGDEISFTDLSDFKGKTKTPSRYGVGRFITEIEHFTRPSTLDSIVDKLEESGYIEVRKGIIFITSLGMAIAEWTDENAPWLANKENTEIMEEALDAIEEGTEDNPDELLFQYSELIENLKKKVGFIEREEWPPTEGEIEMARSIAKKLNLESSELDEIIKYKNKTRDFIEKHKTKRTKIGTCPACKLNNEQGTVYEYENGFSCSNFKNGCKFSLWKKGIGAFLTKLKVPYDSDTITTIVKKGLTTKPLLIEGIEGKRGKYDAYLAIERDIKYGWKISMKFPRNNNRGAA